MEYPITLDLSRHCIETAIKRRHNRSISDYFKAENDRPRLESEIELLQAALTQYDFEALRSRYPALAGRSDAEVRLSRGKGGEVVLTVEKEPIHPLYKDRQVYKDRQDQDR